MRRFVVILSIFVVGCHHEDPQQRVSLRPARIDPAPLQPVFAHPGKAVHRDPQPATPQETSSPTDVSSDQPPDRNLLAGHWEDKKIQGRALDIDRAGNVLYHAGTDDRLGAGFEYSGRLQYGNIPVPNSASGTLLITAESRRQCRQGLDRLIVEADGKAGITREQYDQAFEELDKPMPFRASVDGRDGDLVIQAGEEVARYTRMAG